MQTFAHDIRHAVRAFARTPGFTATALVSLALGIGANTAIFSVANALLLRPLPYADPERLVILWNRSPGLGITEDWFSRRCCSRSSRCLHWCSPRSACTA